MDCAHPDRLGTGYGIRGCRAHTETVLYRAIRAGSCRSGIFPGANRLSDALVPLRRSCESRGDVHGGDSDVQHHRIAFCWMDIEPPLARMRGLEWSFIVEGILAVIFGILTIFYLTDWPKQAKWLPADEKEWLTDELQREKELKARARPYTVWQALRRPEVILLTVIYISGNYRNLFGSSSGFRPS